MGMWGAIGKGGGAAWELGFSLIGEAMSAGKRQQALDLYKDMQANAQGMEIPPFEEIVAQQAEKQPGADPAVREAQMQAMSRMGNLADQNGLDPQAQAQLQQARGSMEQAMSGNNRAIQDNMARRGMSGSGSELAAQLSGNQAASNRGNQAGLDIASQARQRALAALQSQNSMAGNVRAGDLQDQEAQAQRDRFNAQMRAAAQTGNINQKANRFGMQAKKVGMVNQADSDLSGQLYNAADRENKVWSGVGRGANKMSAAGGEMADDMMGMYGGGG